MVQKSTPGYAASQKSLSHIARMTEGILVNKPVQKQWSVSKLTANNQQLLRNKLKLELRYEVNLGFETQIWKPCLDLKMKNLEMKSWIPGLCSKVHSLPPFWQFPTTYYPYCQCLIWKAPFDKTCCELRNKRVTWKCW